MSEIKKIRVREARERDKGLFHKLWKELLLEQQENGSIVRGDSEKNIEIFTNVFKSYTDSSEDGVVLFIGEIAVLMAGNPGNEVELTIGRRPARNWGMYVVPDQREKNIETKLYEAGFKRLREMGFDVIFGGSMSDNNSVALEKVAGSITRASESLVYAKLEK